MSDAADRRTSLLWPSIFAGVAFLILMGLGTWQVERLHWKEALVAQLDARVKAAPQPLPPRDGWARLNPADEEYRRVSARGTYDPKEALIFRGSGKVAGAPAQPGYWVMAPLKLESGGTVLVNRGFVPLDRSQDPARRVPDGVVTVSGLLRAPEERNLFTPRDDVSAGNWYTRDPAAIGAALGLRDVAPFTIDEDAHEAPRGQPAGGATVIDIPNNHLSYAITWYGLGATLVGVYLAFALRRRRSARD